LWIESVAAIRKILNMFSMILKKLGVDGEEGEGQSTTGSAEGASHASSTPPLETTSREEVTNDIS
jgi:hypothetical protein